jgi:long-chain acyl-CoA synthetase
MNAGIYNRATLVLLPRFSPDAALHLMEIEEVLITHPAVSLAAVIGVPHERHGEEVKAFVIVKNGATITKAELVAWSKQNMADYKYPRLIEFRTELPMTATGKVLKSELRS